MCPSRNTILATGGPQLSTQVMTVTGPISSDQLGFTLAHEHIYLDLMRDRWHVNNFLNDIEIAETEVQRYVDAGGKTLVDLTSGGLKGNDQDLLFDEELNHLNHAEAVRAMAEKTGLNIVLGCGWYRESYYEPRLWQMKTDEIAEEIVRDLTEGIDGTDVRAGIIGEIGAHFNRLSAIEERVLRAAGRAQIKTGVGLVTHATLGPHGLAQLDVLMQEGVDPRRVAIAHSGAFPIHRYHEEIAKRGAYVSFDRMGMLPTFNEFERKRTLRRIKMIIDAGYINNLLLSHDVCYRSDYAMNGGAGYDYLSTQGMAILGSEIGLTEEQFHTIMFDNPKRLITGEE